MCSSPSGKKSLSPSETSEQLSIEELCSILRRESGDIKLPDNLPFSELFQPLIHHASENLSRFAQQHSWLAGTLPGLQTQLLHRLCSVATLPIYLWFHLKEHSEDQSGYERFVHSMQTSDASNGWPGLLSEYSELGRLLASIVVAWKATSLQFLERLQSDQPILEDFLGTSTLVVEAAKCGLSDSHDNGRSVIQIQFQNDLRIACKSRELSAETAFAHLLNAIGSEDAELALPSAPVLSRSNYGWMKWLDPSPASNTSAWYAKAGMLQCILQMLGATDAHMANCIATAQGPALIDCECLLTPSYRNPKNSSASQEAPDSDIESIQQISLDIQSTGLLPLLERQQGDPDLSGLFGRGGQPTGYRIPIWNRNNGNSPQLNLRTAVLRPQSNLLPNGAPHISRMAAGKAFAEGFAKMYNYLGRNQSAVLEALNSLAEKPTRVLLRNTRRYTQILSRSIHPRFLHNRETKQQLIRSLLQQEKPVWPLPSDTLHESILDTEVEALERLDVPLFQAKGRNLLLSGRLLAADFFPISRHEAAIQRLQGLNPESLQQTLNCLRLLWIQAATTAW